jgi:DNA repair exonuclease SbcCD nuclease subunit
VFIVPGNHERSRLPHVRLARHRNMHVFDQPCTFTAAVRGTTIALSGFPYEWRDVRTRFPDLLERTGWRRVAESSEPHGSVDGIGRTSGREPGMVRSRSPLRVLCIHHCVEGATVGPADYTFTTAADVIRIRDVPREFAAVLSGHIHRPQVLERDLGGRTVDVPVLYPGSIERTSLAEIDEPKGFMVLTLAIDGRVTWEFRPLPARPMIVRELSASGATADVLERRLRTVIDDVPDDAVLRVRVAGELRDSHLRVLAASHVRRVAPPTMNVDIVTSDGASIVRRPRRRRARAGAADRVAPSAGSRGSRRSSKATDSELPLQLEL